MKTFTLHRSGIPSVDALILANKHLDAIQEYRTLNPGAGLKEGRDWVGLRADLLCHVWT